MLGPCDLISFHSSPEPSALRVNSSPTSATAESTRRQIVVDLKDPFTAGVAAWLVPGAGHIYQGRYGKGILFAVCILGAFFYGLVLGEGRSVYASFSLREGERRLPYIPQVCAGLPALPAVVQAIRVRSNKPPLWNGFEAPPVLPGPGRDPDNIPEDPTKWTLSDLVLRMKDRFELATVYTMIAGLLNVLAIYDAVAGPFLPDDEDAADGDKSQGDKNQQDSTDGAPSGGS